LCEIQGARGDLVDPREDFDSRQSASPVIPENCGLSTSASVCPA
jgi:hypothetical protein